MSDWTEWNISDWIEWKGGDCPVEPDTLVEVRFRDGTVDARVLEACNWLWWHSENKEDIVAYRVVERVVEAPAPTEGRKDDQDKDRVDLFPPEAIFAISRVLSYGARKYAPRNWEKGMSWGRVFGALMRHLWAWWGGKGPTTKNFLFGDTDTETGFSHLWHAGCCLVFLIAYEERGVGDDDRMK